MSDFSPDEQPGGPGSGLRHSAHRPEGQYGSDETHFSLLHCVISVSSRTRYPRPFVHSSLVTFFSFPPLTVLFAARGFRPPATRPRGGSDPRPRVWLLLHPVGGSDPRALWGSDTRPPGGTDLGPGVRTPPLDALPCPRKTYLARCRVDPNRPWPPLPGTALLHWFPRARDRARRCRSDPGPAGPRPPRAPLALLNRVGPEEYLRK